MKRPSRFNKRAFISFFVLIIGLIISLTGLILYMAPPGRIAHWVEWGFLGLTKEEWQSLHTNFSFVFIIAIVFHLVYNWVVFWSYIKSAAVKGIKMGRELGASAIMALMLFVIIAAGLPPFSSVMDLSTSLSNSWSNQETEPPVPHAETFTLKEYAELTKQSLYVVMHSLNRAQLKGVDSLITIGDLATLNGKTPREIASGISEKQPGVALASMAGFGYGRKTVAEICDETGIDQNLALQRLNKAAIEYDGGQNLREIANSNNLKPIDIVNIIKGEPSGKGEERL